LATGTSDRLQALFGWIESFTNLERSGAVFSARAYQLERMRRLSERLGSPQDGFRSFHVAGSKGKGSTAALLAWSLQAAGLRTGLYTSPHVESYLERYAVLEEGASDSCPQLLVELGACLREGIDALPGEFLEELGRPTTFELLTLLAFELFRESRCRAAVLETGIGGRLDATNVVTPELCLLTPIEKEHTDVLGETLEEIAREKGGIIKPGVPVYSAPQAPAAREVLRGIAADRGSPIAFLDEELAELSSRYTPEGTELAVRFRGEPERRYRLALIGDYQAENAALVDLAARRTLGLPGEALERGFLAARLPARLELLRSRPPVVLDGGHTPRSVERVLAVFRTLFGGQGVLLFGAARGKKIAEMAALLAPAFERIVITTPGTFKESDPAEAHRLFRALAPAARLEPDTGAALELALELTEARRPLLVLGSFYLAGEVRRRLLAPSGQSAGA
jgi:dihydrofolate synthase/folylpolyglutamate synthase